MSAHSQIVDDLGGGTKLAEEMKTTATPADRETIYAWKARGSIPARYWPALIEVARRQGKALTADDFLQGASPLVTITPQARPQTQPDQENQIGSSAEGGARRRAVG